MGLLSLRLSFCLWANDRHFSLAICSLKDSAKCQEKLSLPSTRRIENLVIVALYAHALPAISHVVMNSSDDDCQHHNGFYPQGWPQVHRSVLLLLLTPAGSLSAQKNLNLC